MRRGRPVQPPLRVVLAVPAGAGAAAAAARQCAPWHALLAAAMLRLLWVW